MAPEKEPLLTRAKIRELKEQDSLANRIREQELAKEYEQKSRKIKATFSKKQKKIKPIKNSRTAQVEKSRNLSNFLWKAIIVVTLLLAVLAYAVFKL